MNTKIYIVRFYHTDSSEIEDFEWGIEEAARDHFDLFGIGDADIYTRIDLIEHDWGTHTEKVLDSKFFRRAEKLSKTTLANRPPQSDEYDAAADPGGRTPTATKSTSAKSAERNTTMYDNENEGFEIEEGYSEEQFQDDLLGILAGWYSPDDTALDPAGSVIRTYAQEGVMTYNKGLVVRLGNGTEFQITIVQSR